MQSRLIRNMNSFQNHHFWIFFLFISFAVASADSMTASKDYIVFTDQPPLGQDLRDYALQILTALLHSKRDAEGALEYVYRIVGPGFSARLTPEQASQLQHEPGVLYVKESELYDHDAEGVALSF